MSNAFLDVARALALQAGDSILHLRQSPLTRERKADHSLVTNADRQADRIIREGLSHAFPRHAVLTEESGCEGDPSSEYVWVVDPLDGTKAYAEGVAGFSVMVGLLRNGTPVAGLVFDPLEGRLYEAEKGEGAFLSSGGERRQVRVSTRGKLTDMPVITSKGFPKEIESHLRSPLPGPWVPAINSVGIKVGALVRQEADIYINHHKVHYWDTCAPQIILEEAGGTITFLNGRPIDYPLAGKSFQHPGPTLATNGVLHQTILTLVQAAMPPHD